MRLAGAHFDSPERMFKIGDTKDWTKLREEGGNITGGKAETSPIYDKEVEILQWFLEKRDLQLAVSTEKLKQQAKMAISKTNPGFKASNRWEQKFKRRHNLM